ncbi:hypothetical protein C8R46DRAFT_1077910 [Mycena filopes]|nr:hypothetical protein C8R46DRAFT_1077910 [Mycena filopes]
MLGHLAAARARVAELEAQHLRLHDQHCLPDLELEKHLAQERLDTYHYPVLTLPNEITTEIFTHFVPALPLRPPLIGIASPTVLTQICRAWRDIAISTPTLWRAMSLTNLNIPFVSAVELADLWIRRSRSCRLSIEIDYPARGQHGVSSLLLRLFEEAARLEDLKLDTRTAHLPATPRPMPLLRHLDLSLISDLSNTNIVLFRDAPELRTVRLNHQAAADLQLPWAQLTSVALTAVFAYECAAVLRQTPNVLHCELSLMKQITSPPATELTLPSLQSLVLDHVEPFFFAYLQTLTLPVLRNLTIPESFLGEDPIDTLTRFIAKSDCELQELCITNRIKDPSIYRRGFPLIPTLTIRGWRFKDSDAGPEESISEVDNLAILSSDE